MGCISREPDTSQRKHLRRRGKVRALRSEGERAGKKEISVRQPDPIAKKAQTLKRSPVILGKEAKEAEEVLEERKGRNAN